ncbi:hypothetical protein O3M35_007208 [Rhynocoris fuscipes]|uniref:Neuroendocrine protein 7B2 n=1 Tax=Rhynocoris fuscipes TaxID=488301 RepID=A0AAW1DBB0_9HEMI
MESGPPDSVTTVSHDTGIITNFNLNKINNSSKLNPLNSVSSKSTTTNGKMTKNKKVLLTNIPRPLNKKRSSSLATSPPKTKRTASLIITPSSSDDANLISVNQSSQPSTSVNATPACPQTTTGLNATNVAEQNEVETIVAPPGVITYNPFSPIAPPEEMDEATPTERIHKPPPIYVKNINKFSDLCGALSQLVGRNSFTCKSRITDLIINPSTPDTYRSIIKYLSSHNAEYHTYQLPEEKAYRVVIRYLHQTTPKEMIKAELEELGHSVRSVSPVLHPATKQLLPLFFVDLEPRQNNRDIFDLEVLCYTRIKVEEPHKQRQIVQCKRCQEYGHTKSYCRHRPRCVKCAREHFTHECDKLRTTPATCALCNGEHPANYKGCIVHKELQRTRKVTPDKKTPPIHTNRPVFQPNDFPALPQQPPATNTITHSRPTMSEVAARPPPLQPWLHNKEKMGLAGLLILGVCAYGTLAYFSAPQDHTGLSEILLREVVDKMGRDLDNYLDEVSTGRLIFPPLMSRSDKDSDYQDNPIPRDQEYLQHSTLLSGPFLQQQEADEKATNNLQNGNQQNGAKQDNLPAYCNPPNPCPIGYTAEDGCLEEFENTAAFSREYQARQDCMCDTEHMFDCSNPRNTDGITQSDLDRLVHQFHVEDEHKTLVAKKYHEKKAVNPYLLGEKLPVAAKKGINIIDN